MAVAPLGADPAAAFAELRRRARRLLEEHPDATAMSAGHVRRPGAGGRHGATHVRVGTALLGARPPVSR
jgi:uncharacterized pyridoxal phosphate-containing UPF0001 family protein